jgi:hypothetical protein
MKDGIEEHARKTGSAASAPRKGLVSSYAVSRRYPSPLRFMRAFSLKLGF